MTKRFLFTTLLIAGLANSVLADRMEKLTSPNGKIVANINISLDFLNRPAMLTSFRDGRNAHRIAVDYKKQVQQVTPSTQLKLHLVRNGGWCGSFE